MLFEIDPEGRVATPQPHVPLAELGYRERYDLQEWVLSNPRLLGEDLFVVTDEYAGFDRTRERLDILAIDSDGKLVVVELKRSAVGSHADLQAIRYAAYCSTLRLLDLAEIHVEFRRRRGEEISTDEARARIRAHIEDPDFIELDNRPRIILGAEEFPPEITASALWLRDCDIDVRCVRLRPYRIGERLVLEASVLIPLPEAEAFLIRRERKEAQTTQQVLTETNSEEVRSFYEAVVERLREAPGFGRKTPPRSSDLYYRAMGKRTYLGVKRRPDFIRVELYIDEGAREFNRGILDALRREQAAIESEVGDVLTWEGGGAARKCTVYVDQPVASPASDPEALSWATATLVRFREAFSSRFEAAAAAAATDSVELPVDAAPH